ncbi:MAG: DUF2063 domain-containing protein [Rhizobiaceae bacterium]|nr:MAG: DUF2063 domain-containing protein [Rhizobiaceae bacterium]CAG1008785.1 hypothetical protein RHIZO_03542 [Rhizobiaceae bacterium]
MGTATLDLFAAALTDPRSPLPAGLTTARGDADAARFAVYRNNVHVGLTNALAQRFPVTEQLVGAEFFRGMARIYAQDHKPASPLMFEYGDDFPDFIAGFVPAAGLAYLPDVARVEAAWSRAYHAADAIALPVTTLAALAPEGLAGTRLPRHPSASLVASPYPVGSIWAAHQTEPVGAVAASRPEIVLVVRPDAVVNVHVLPAADAAFAAAVLAGQTLGEAAGQALDANAEFDFGAALVGLVTLGAFAATERG